MIFELAQDFHDAVVAMPTEHQKHRMLELLEEAVRRDIHFIDRHPTTLFQCMWNTCWWYDCPEAEAYYEMEEPITVAHPPPWNQPGLKLHWVMASWFGQKGNAIPGAQWLRATSPPSVSLGHPEMTPLQGHTGDHFCYAFSRDNQLLVTGCVDFYTPTETGLRDTTARIWDIQTGQEIACYRRHVNGVGAVALSPDQTLVASGGCGTSDPYVHVWRLETQQLLWRFCPSPYKSTAELLRFSQCGRWLICVAKQTIDIWRLTKEGDKEWVQPVSIKFCGNPPATCIENGTLKDTDLWAHVLDGWLEVEILWISGREQLLVPFEGSSQVQIVETSGLPDGARISFPGTFLTGAQCASVLWRARNRLKRITRNCARAFGTSSTKPPPAPFRSIRYDSDHWCHSSDGRYVAAIRRGRWRATVYDATTAEELAHLTGVKSSRLTFSDDASLLALTNNDNTIIIWRWRSERVCCRYTLRKVARHVFEESSPQGKYHADKEDDTIKITERNTGKTICKTAGVRLSYRVVPGETATVPTAEIKSFALSRDGMRLVWAQYTRGIRIWDFEEDPPERFAWDGMVFPNQAVPLPEPCDHGFDTTKAMALEDNGLEDLPAELSFSADGRLVAGGDARYRTSTLWDATTGKCLLVERNYIQPRVLADGTQMFAYRARLSQVETSIERADSHQSVSWLPLVTASLADPSGSPEWVFLTRESHAEKDERLCQVFRLDLLGSGQGPPIA